MEENNKVVESPHSVKISINAKGLFSGEVKCYGTTPDEAAERTMKLVDKLERLIKEKNE